jgi:hypothetical protein
MADFNLQDAQRKIADLNERVGALEQQRKYPSAPANPGLTLADSQRDYIHQAIEAGIDRRIAELGAAVK